MIDNFLHRDEIFHMFYYENVRNLQVSGIMTFPICLMDGWHNDADGDRQSVVVTRD